jgi:hypothetical protein
VLDAEQPLAVGDILSIASRHSTPRTVLRCQRSRAAGVKRQRR